ncbi:MAG: alkaline phosphatase D family protein [Myxococcota bacterium]
MIRLHAHAAPPGFVDLWLGVSGVIGGVEPSWWVDGEPVHPQMLRPMEPVRVGEAAPAEGRSRTFTGGFRLKVVGSAEVQVRVKVGEDSASLVTRPVPTELPEDRWFNILLGSCFDRTMERAPNLVNRVVQHLCNDPDLRPDLSLFMGDQVYLDVPATDMIGRFGEPGLTGITGQFEEDYRLNWFVHLADVLSAAPFVCVPDDHEFWNNYPTRVAWLPRTLSASGRAEWEAAAVRCYDTFQRSVGLDDPAVINVGPLSIFVLDTRTWRRPDRDACATPEHLERLRAWAKQVRENKQYGVFVTGQTLFKPAVNPVRGLLTDFELANYGDYKAIMEALYQGATPDRPLFCLTGDVHFGRVIQASDRQGRPRMYEIISSPMSLCGDPRSAHQPWLSAFFQRFFGELWIKDNRPWPRHPTPSAPAAVLPTSPDRSEQLQCVTRFTQRGNQIALLGFRAGKKAGEVQVRVGYVAVHPDERRWNPVWVGPFNPKHGIDVLGALGLFSSLAGNRVG